MSALNVLTGVARRMTSAGSTIVVPDRYVSRQSCSTSSGATKLLGRHHIRNRGDGSARSTASRGEGPVPHPEAVQVVRVAGQLLLHRRQRVGIRYVGHRLLVVERVERLVERR